MIPSRVLLTLASKEFSTTAVHHASAANGPEPIMLKTGLGTS
jgi:hypothetical protein